MEIAIGVFVGLVLVLFLFRPAKEVKIEHAGKIVFKKQSEKIAEVESEILNIIEVKNDHPYKTPMNDDKMDQLRKEVTQQVQNMSQLSYRNDDASIRDEYEILKAEINRIGLKDNNGYLMKPQNLNKHQKQTILFHKGNKNG